MYTWLSEEISFVLFVSIVQTKISMPKNEIEMAEENRNGLIL